ncbi:hypothetical protein [Pseudooceanicola sp.]|uniref:hypothetical protein n=1 Tax=Pseudooceanicola sp. TaxID=1914328 RepID=UPI0035C702BE
MVDTPEPVSRHATEKGALDLSSTALLGTLVEPEGPRALIRTSNGAIRKVAPGDRIGTARVQAIATGMVQMVNLGMVQTLTMPGQ